MTVDSLYHDTGRLPESITFQNYGITEIDFSKDITYTPLSSTTFELCTIFDDNVTKNHPSPCTMNPDSYADPFDLHGSGKQCFTMEVNQWIPGGVLCGAAPSYVFFGIPFAWTDPILKLFVK